MSNNQNQGQANQTRPTSLVAQTQQQWEYWQEYECSATRLNALGKDGWRLVGSPVIPRIELGSGGKLLYIFERPVRPR